MHPDVTQRHCETWPGVARTAVVTAGAVIVAWHTPDVSPRALIVFLCLGLPALARAIIAPVMAWMLRGVKPVAVEMYDESLLASQKLDKPKLPGA